MAELGSAPVPGPTAEDHARGPEDAPLVIVYTDFECPFCAAFYARLGSRQVRVVARHFPVRSRHPRAWAAACAAEAAARQGRFWEMHDSLFAEQGRLEDPHLWDRARALAIDIERFDRDRRSEPTILRVRRDFESGVRAGVVTTPTIFVAGEMHAGQIDGHELDRLLGPHPD